MRELEAEARKGARIGYEISPQEIATRNGDDNWPTGNGDEKQG